MLVVRRLYSRRVPSARVVHKSKIDPGISQQKKIFAQTREDVEEIDFEELESDFMSVHKTHKEHVEQMEAWKEKEKYLIVKQKYFKEKLPNFLTWHDKEQIRYLHNTDPKEWSIERLSEGFPALPDVIEKIVRNNWTKKNRSKVAAHDKAVIQHWSDFKLGKLGNLPNELKEHIQKFSNRSLNLNQFEIPDDKGKIVRNKSENKRPGEFFEIIASYERLKRRNSNNDEIQDRDKELQYINSKTTNSNEIATLDKNNSLRKDQRLFTFKELQQKVEKEESRGKNISEQDKLILKQPPPHTQEDFNTTVTLQPEEISKIVEQRHQVNSDKVGFVRKTTRDMSHLIYPEKIVIPKKHYKKGYTYKLNDCYYDCDGEFLYRVPGMS